MWNEPTQERLAQIPGLYETEEVPLAEKSIHLHFFIGGCDWWITEYDGNDIFFGFAVLNSDHQNSEWGYISFDELRQVKIGGWVEVDCELEEFWTVKKAKEIPAIKV